MRPLPDERFLKDSPVLRAGKNRIGLSGVPSACDDSTETIFANAANTDEARFEKDPSGSDLKMKFWIVGTDTNIGKTTVAAWLCLHSGYEYWKPVQTGCRENSDSLTVKNLSGAFTHREAYCFAEPLSPHLASLCCGRVIDPGKIFIPDSKKLIIEAAGGLMVPLNKDLVYIDFIKNTGIPVILVAGSRLGTINHTCLSLEALKIRKIHTLGVIMTGEKNDDILESIEKYGQTEVLAVLPHLDMVTKSSLVAVELTQKLRNIINAQQ